MANISPAESQLDEQFIVYMLEIDGRYKSMMRQDRTRVEQWSKVLCQANGSIVWKRNRNLYAMQLLDCVLNTSLNKPFSRPPPAQAIRNTSLNRQKLEHQKDDSDSTAPNNDFVLPLLNKTQVTSQLSIRFKHMKLEVDKQRIMTQLQSSQSEPGTQEDHDTGVSLSYDNESYSDRQLPQQQLQHLSHHRMHTQTAAALRKESDDFDEELNPRPQYPNSVVRLKPSREQTGRQKNASTKSFQPEKKADENYQRNFQDMQAQLMLEAAEEQLKQYDMPRPAGEVTNLRQEVVSLKESNRAFACQVAQLRTQIEVQMIAEKHMKEQMQVKDSMLTMQEDMLSALNAEVEKLKLMLLAKTNKNNDFNSIDTQAHQSQQQKQFMSESTTRLANTAKAYVAPVITKGRAPARADQLYGKYQREKKLIVSDEITEAKRQFKKRQIEQQLQGKDNDPTSPLIQSHVSLSEDGDEQQSLQMDSRSSNAPRQINHNLQQTKAAAATIISHQNEDGATLQLQNYINSVDDSDLNFLQESSFLLSQSRPPKTSKTQQQFQQKYHQQQQPVDTQAASMMFGESDRFLEEVLLSRRVDFDGQGKNDFLPKRTENGGGMLPTVGEMSIQDLSAQYDERTVHKSMTQDAVDRTHTQQCNRTVDCSCGCEDESFAHSNINRTQQDTRDMRRIQDQRMFFAQINTEIASCTQDDSRHQQQEEIDQFVESRATSNGSPARLLEQLLASQGASAFQSKFNYKKEKTDAESGIFEQDGDEEDDELLRNLQASAQMPESIHRY